MGAVQVPEVSPKCWAGVFQRRERGLGPRGLSHRVLCLAGAGEQRPSVFPSKILSHVATQAPSLPAAGPSFGQQATLLGL